MAALAHAQSRSRPASFAERGCVVPFETPALFAARVRAERNELVVLMPNFSDSGSLYVVPWKDVPSVVPMRAFDCALHEAIGESDACSPWAVRAAVRRVAAKSGEAAQLLVEAETERRLLTEIQTALLTNFASQMAGDLVREGAADCVAGLLRRTAATAGTTANELFRRTECLAHELLPLGLTAAPGPLRRLHLELAAFARHLQRRTDAAPAETQQYLCKMMRAAIETLQSSAASLAAIDRSLVRVAAALWDWRDEQPGIRATIRRLAWLQDGWEQVLDRYAKYLEAQQQLGVRESELALISALTPLVPEDVLAQM